MNYSSPPIATPSPQVRQLPFNEEAEQALLGALLVNNRAYNKVSELLKPKHFHRPVHGRLYQLIGNMVDKSAVANPATLKSYFERDPDLASVGGSTYLADLAASMVTVVNAVDYANTIHDCYIRRELITMGEHVVNEAHVFDYDNPSKGQIESAEKVLFDLATDSDVGGGFVILDKGLKLALDSAEAAFRKGTKLTGVTTGMVELDRQLGGLNNSDLLILAGRPSMGKTALATNIAVNAAKAYMDSGGTEGAVVAFFSLEMSLEQLANRILADESRTPSDRIRRGDVQERDFHRFGEATQRLCRLPLHIDDTAGITLSSMRSRARRLKRTANLGLIVVDYLQLMRSGGSGQYREENRVQEVSEITRGLKALAKEINVPVLALSQLSRAVENREDKRPQLADLRESGSIEQDADVVMFVYRHEYYLQRSEPEKKPDESQEKFNDRCQSWQQASDEAAGKGDCIIAKQRHGPIGTVTLKFEAEFTHFTNL